MGPEVHLTNNRPLFPVPGDESGIVYPANRSAPSHRRSDGSSPTLRHPKRPPPCHPDRSDPDTTSSQSKRPPAFVIPTEAKRSGGIGCSPYRRAEGMAGGEDSGTVSLGWSDTKKRFEWSVRRISQNGNFAAELLQWQTHTRLHGKILSVFRTNRDNSES